MFRILTCFLTLWVLSCNALVYQDFNEEKCTVVNVQGYKYTQFYNFPNEISNNANIKVLKFYVQGMSNAHIMLTSEPSSFGYEIVLGGGNNTFCDLRRSSPSMKSMYMVNMNRVLTVDKPIGFWIRVTQQNGLIEVGKINEILPFMFWEDPTPIPVKYFAFSAWDNVFCKWLFNCQSNETSEITNKGNRKFSTYTEQLRKDVLKKHNLFGVGNPPLNSENMLNVTITNNFKYIHLDVMTSILTLRGFATFEWTDNTINWDPKSYKNISKLHLSNYELWQPELVLHNALNPAANVFSEAKISVDNNGRVIWKPKFSIKTNCDVDLRSWPWDQHKCTVLLSTWSHKISNIFYEIKNNSHSDCTQMAYSDWKLNSLTSSYVEEDTPWDDILTTINNENDDSLEQQKALQLVIEISRNTKILEKLFHIPLLLISCLWLSSFCLMSQDPSTKIMTICASIILSTITMAYMTTYVPVFFKLPPALLVRYLKLMLLISTDALISSFFITIHRHITTDDHPPFALTRFLTTPIITKLLILPKLELVSDSKQILDDCLATKLEEELLHTNTSTTTLWDIVIVAIQRIIFVIYFTITVIILNSSA